MANGGDALDAALDELYDVDPSEFTATRTRLVAALRPVDPAGARSLKDARRPTTAAWAMNRVSRDAPTLVAEYLDRSRELHDAQSGEGGRDGLRDATRAQRDALARLTDAALACLGDRATDSYRAQVVATLHAAVVDGEVGEQLQRGRLTKEVSGVSGFPEVPGLSVVPPLPAERPAKRKAPSRPRARAPQSARSAPDADGRTTEGDPAARAEAEAAALEARAARAERARRELADAEQAADVARAVADAAEAAATAAHARARRLEEDLEQSRREAREADTAAARARREAAQLARTATKLRSRAPKES